jgi:hypothetical protein
LWSLGWASGAHLGFWIHGFLLGAMLSAGLGLLSEVKNVRNQDT